MNTHDTDPGRTAGAGNPEGHPEGTPVPSAAAPISAADAGKRKRRRVLRWIENVLLLVLLAWAGQRLLPQVAAAVGADLGVKPSPELEVETRDGGYFSLASHRGQVVLVNFWATWCRPCRVEMPGFQKVYDRYRDQGFTLVGLSTDAGGGSEVDRFVSERGVTYPVALATSRARREFGGVREIPTSFLIDRQGRIRYTVRGIWAGPALSRAVRLLLEEEADGPAAP